MKRLVLIVLLCLCFTYASRAQYAGLYVGSNIASGAFSNNNFSDDESGFAQTGYSYGLAVLYPIHSNLGLCTDFGQATAAFNSNAYTKALNLSDPQAAYDMVASNPYRINHALAGIHGFIPFNHFTLGVKLQLGFAHVTVPEKKINQEFAGKYYTRVIGSATDLSAAFNWGLMATYKLGNRLLLTAQVDNFYAPTVFRFNYFSATDEPQALPVNTFRLCLGVGVLLQNK
jgi:hypothetical protein